jgi:hypothetical protein
MMKARSFYKGIPLPIKLPEWTYWWVFVKPRNLWHKGDFSVIILGCEAHKWTPYEKHKGVFLHITVLNFGLEFGAYDTRPEYGILCGPVMVESTSPTQRR